MPDLSFNVPSLVSRPMIMDEIQFQNDTKWYLMGTGFDAVNHSPNAQTLSRRYVNEEADSTFTVGYQSTIDFTFDEMDDDLHRRLLDIARDREVGANTIVKHRRTYMHLPFMHKETGFVVPTHAKSYEEWCNVIISNENPRDNMLSAAGQLTYVSGFTTGGYDPLVKSFTPADEMAAGTAPSEGA